MPRFVILTHKTPASSPRGLHWDLMLEEPDCLRTWARLRTWALTSPLVDQEPIEAEQLPDHRSEYLDFEGPVSRNRGSVSRWDFGQYQVILQRTDQLVLQVSGQRLTGRIELTRTAASTSQWTVRYLAE